MCGQVDDASEVDALPGPGMPAERAQRMEERLAARAAKSHAAAR